MPIIMTIVTQACIFCGEGGVIEMTQEVWNNGLAMRNEGKHIQDAFPTLNAGEREQLLTGTHEVCWDNEFGHCEELGEDKGEE